MAMGKYSRVDGKKSSSYGLTFTIVVLVSLCFVGAWMFMSSWSAPADSVSYSSSDTPKDVEPVTKNDLRKEEEKKNFSDEKKEENEAVTENNEVKNDSEKSDEGNQIDESSGEKTEAAQERKESDESNGDGDEEKEKNVKEAESEKEKTQLEESTEENKSEDGNGNEEKSEEKSEENANETEESTEKSTKEVFPAGDQAEITKESSTGDGAWSTQLVESQNEKNSQKSSTSKDQSSYEWKTCNVTAGPDYIPCLDNWQVIKKLHSTMHYEHRERRKNEEDSGIWKAMSKLTKAMCWKLVTIKKDKLNEVGAAIYQKPTSNKCYSKRPQNDPPLCKDSDDQNAAWNVPLEACMHKVTEDSSKRGAVWPNMWPERLETAPEWLDSQEGVYGKPAQEDFTADQEKWKTVVSKLYLNDMGIDWSNVRNVMDMRAVYGGFAAALKDLKLWVMNVVPVDAPDTLPIIYERGLFGIYHDWCESFNTYPRTYDLLHADHLFSTLRKRCSLVSVMAEIDRILRPQGTFIIRDDMETISEVEKMVKSMKWNVKVTQSKDSEGLLSIQKSWWRPTETETIKSAIA